MRFCGIHLRATQKANFVGPTWGPPGSCRPQVGPMLAPWTLLLGKLTASVQVIILYNGFECYIFEIIDICHMGYWKRNHIERDVLLELLT